MWLQGNYCTGVYVPKLTTVTCTAHTSVYGYCSVIKVQGILCMTGNQLGGELGEMAENVLTHTYTNVLYEYTTITLKGVLRTLLY